MGKGKRQLPCKQKKNKNKISLAQLSSSPAKHNFDQHQQQDLLG